ncbi:NAD/NADP octopine/nopaline dehydrogenase family protein [Pelagibacterium sp.]|uniref:NAD/NADP octopine/nopaline dehydrogenase family protein n=1 Tax=Pelagibacterium sp. TaxID=1967288 RepID=UPI003BA8DBFB
MRVAVLGGGPVGLTYAAMLLNNGHDVVVHSASASTTDLHMEVQGAIEFSGLISLNTELATAIDGADVLVCSRRASGVKEIIDQLVEIATPQQVIIFSAELSLSSQYAALKLADAGRHNPIVSWSTTVATAQRRNPTLVVSGTLRDRIDYAVTNSDEPDQLHSLLIDLFGERFHRLPNALAVALSNLNPPIHLANSLANLTRMEKGEDWDNYANITPAVGRLIEALDVERLALARHLNLDVRNVHEHYLRTFPGLERASVSEMASQVAAASPGTPGPKSIDSRYLTEDIPFGLLPLLALAKQVEVPMPVHHAGILLASTYTGEDFFRQNMMLPHVEAHWSSIGAGR